MGCKLEAPEQTKRVLRVDVSASRVAQEIDRLSEYYGKRTTVDGFRAGRVPSQVIRAKQLSKLQEEAIDRVIREAYREALEQCKLAPINIAEIDEIRFERESMLSFRASFEVIPEIEIKHYKHLRGTRRMRQVKEHDVDSELERLREASVVLKPVERAATLSDAVVADLRVFQGRQLVREVAESTVLVKNLVPELQNQMVGKMPGDRVTVEGDGKVTTISIREVKEPVYPQVDDAFAKDVGFDNLTVLRDKIAGELERAEDLRSQREVQDEIVNHLIEKNPFEAPASLVEAQLGQISSNKEEWEKYRTDAIFLVKRDIVLDKVAAAENMSVDEEELDQEIQGIAESRNIPSQRLKNELKKSGRIDVLRESLKRRKALKFLVDNASIKTKNVKE